MDDDHDRLLERLDGVQPEGNLITDAVVIIESFDPADGQSYVSIVVHPGGLWWKHRGMVHGAGVDMDAHWRTQSAGDD